MKIILLRTLFRYMYINLISNCIEHRVTVAITVVFFVTKTHHILFEFPEIEKPRSPEGDQSPGLEEIQLDYDTKDLDQFLNH